MAKRIDTVSILMRVSAKTAAFRGRRIESRTPNLGVLDEQFCQSCDDLAIEPLSERLIVSCRDCIRQRIGHPAQPVHKHF